MVVVWLSGWLFGDRFGLLGCGCFGFWVVCFSFVCGVFFFCVWGVVMVVCDGVVLGDLVGVLYEFSGFC